MAKDILHVVPHEQAWAVKREGNERASSTHETQKDAIEAARELAKERDDIVIHRADGTIRERVTYMGSNGDAEPAAATPAPGIRTADGLPETEDLVGVGSRVSWGAVLAGVVVAVTTYFTLSFLALAIGLSTMDRALGSHLQHLNGRDLGDHPAREHVRGRPDRQPHHRRGEPDGGRRLRRARLGHDVPAPRGRRSQLRRLGAASTRPHRGRTHRFPANPAGTRPHSPTSGALRALGPKLGIPRTRKCWPGGPSPAWRSRSCPRSAGEWPALAPSYTCGTRTADGAVVVPRPA